MAARSKRLSRQHPRGDGAPAAATAGVTPLRAGTVQGRRWPVVDLLRGCALLAMIAYHFCFDLAYYGWLQADFAGDLRWIWFRRPILGSFLFLAGFSLALAEAQGQAAVHFWRRIGVIAAAAALVSLGSYAMFPQSFIYFGVLHAIALMSILARVVLRAGGGSSSSSSSSTTTTTTTGAAAIALGIAVLAIGNVVESPVFDRPALHWIGLMTFKPRTEDYVPLLPWFGMMLLGAGLGARAARMPSIARTFAGRPVPQMLRWIEWMGRHSLAIYLLHQPLLLGAMMALRKF